MPKANFKRLVLTKDLLDGWSRQDQTNRRAVVFVHGFMGDPTATWKASREAKAFPELLTLDPKVDDFDVYQFKYRSNPFSGSSIRNIARQLEAEINNSLPDYHLVLLAHSMGGLVCMQYIVNQLEKGEYLPILGLLLFGTPSTGVEWVNIADIVLSLGGLGLKAVATLKRLFESNSQLRELNTASQFLQELQDNWILRVVNGGYPSESPARRAWCPVRVVTGNEDWVVKERSAKGLYGQIDWRPVPYGHRALVKPDGNKHVCYKTATEFLARCRSSYAADILADLRGLSDWVWRQRETKLIRDWQMEVHFYKEGEQPAESRLQLLGFSVCEVKCSYRLLLIDDKPFSFGLTLGQDAARSTWKGNPSYLHQIYLNAMKESDRDSISETIRAQLVKPDQAWSAVFENVRMKIADSKGVVYDLVASNSEMAEDRALTYYTLPEAAKSLIGGEVKLEIGFRSLRPKGLNDFTIQFPWLTSGFDALVVIHEKTEYLVAASQILGESKPIIQPPEDYGQGQKIRINGDKNLVLPGSSIRIEWLPR